MKSAKKQLALIVPHTHWDREWRYPIWRNRALLVDFMKQLLTLLEEDGEYRCFVTDGQVVMIEDYLEICPGDADRISQLVKTDRLKIGPWYTLPDLYPLDGECLVRNLLKGKRISDKLGGHLGVGYNSFGWGQTAQFPQIYQGFGFNFAIAAKRVSAERAPRCEYWWEGPDGSRLLSTRLGKEARANGYFHMYLPVRFGFEYLSESYRYNWGTSGQVMHRADAASASTDYFRIDAETGYHPEILKESLAAAWGAMDETMVPDVRLILDGSDFSNPQPVLTRIVRDANELADGREYRLGTLEEYALLLHERLGNNPDVPVVKGELRDGPACSCSGNALATRIHIKQLNKKAENALIRRAEPLATLLAMTGVTYPLAFLNLAWRYLLQSHPHDSINGVTQDKTAEDTCNRLSQAVELAEVAFDESVACLIRDIDLSTFKADDVMLLAVNTDPHPATGVLKLCIDTPHDWNAWDVDLFDSKGNRLEVQNIARKQMTCPVNDPEARPWPFDYDRHTVYVDAGEIPAGGYKVLRVATRSTFVRKAEWWPQMRTTPGNAIAKNPRVLENEYLRVEFQPDGTLDLTDKSSGRTMRNTHYFEDTGDIGDYWAYYPPLRNRTFVSCGAPAEISLEDNGPLSATIVVATSMMLPAHCAIPEKTVIGESTRSDDRVEVKIESRFTLTRGSRRLEVRTVIHNTAADHRMRLMLPTGIHTDTTASAGHFNVDCRPNIPARDSRGEYWPEMQTVPMQMFVDVSDGSNGLAVVNNSFTECQLLEDSDGTLAITLFRAVRNRICTEYRSSGNFPEQNGAQLLRTLEYEYALYPHAGDWNQGDVFAQACAFNTPVASYQISKGRDAGSLPCDLSMLDISPSTLVLSALKKAEDRESFVIRIHNPTAATVAGCIRFHVKPKAAWLVNLDETRQGSLKINTYGGIEVSLAPSKIQTIEIEVSK